MKIITKTEKSKLPATMEEADNNKFYLCKVDWDTDLRICGISDDGNFIVMNDTHFVERMNKESYEIIREITKLVVE